MRDAVIVEAIRTPVAIGKPERGALSGVHPVDLSAHVLRALVARTGIDPMAIDDVLWGCVSQVGEQSANIARNAVLAAGLPETVPGVTIDRQCGSSQQAASFAAAIVMSGQADVMIAGGVESMSRVPMFSNMRGTGAHGDEGPFSLQLRDRYDDGLVNQGVSAEMIAERWKLSRHYLDELAAVSHDRAASATEQGKFADEIIPVPIADGVFETDQGIRAGTTVGSLAALPTPFMPNGVVTAGNASQISDGAAAMLIMSSETARSMGLTPIARFHSFAMAGVDPIIMLTAPIPATQKVLKKAGLSIDDIGVFEVNEAFAAVLGAWLVDTGANHGRVNPSGGAIALGHPLGASGARLTATLVHEMARTGSRYGLQTMCEGGGMANAMVLELL